MVDDGLATIEIKVLVELGGHEKNSTRDEIIEEIPRVDEQEALKRAEKRSVDKKADYIRQPVDMNLGFSRDKIAGERDFGIAQEKDLQEQDRGGQSIRDMQESGLPSPEIAVKDEHQHKEREERLKKDRFFEPGEIMPPRRPLCNLKHPVRLQGGRDVGERPDPEQ